MIGHLARDARSYLEVGVREGVSLEAALDHGKIERLLLCDTWCRSSGGTGRGSHDHIVGLLKRREYTGEVTFLDGRSQTTLKKVEVPERFDLTHIDGGHGYTEALADLQNAWKLTEHTMIAHDIGAKAAHVRAAVWGAVVEFGKVADDASASCAFGEWGTVWFTRKEGT